MSQVCLLGGMESLVTSADGSGSVAAGVIGRESPNLLCFELSKLCFDALSGVIGQIGLSEGGRAGASGEGEA